MLLAIDIGNTDIVFAINVKDEWVYHWRERSDVDKLSETFAFNLRNQFLEQDLVINDVRKIVISSVVPALTPVITNMMTMVFNHKPLIVGSDIYSQLSITTNNPKEIGTDLVANAAAAFHKYHDFCVIIDFGTALTFTTIDDHGTILGVSIAPGLKTAMKCLSGNTAQLPEIPLILPESVLGKDTVHALQAGILHGYIGLVENMITKINAEVGRSFKVIATGGLSSVLIPLHKSFDEICPLLTLEGLKVIADEVAMY